MKRYSIGLLLAGIGLIAGSCVPLVQAVRGGAGDPILRVDLPPRGGTAPLQVESTVTVIPVAVIEPAPGAGTGALVAYELVIADEAGKALTREPGTAGLAPATDGPDPGPLAVRLSRVTLPPGRWTVGWRIGDGIELVDGAEVRLVRPAAGPVGLLLTALVVGILGWLTAVLGALQWIRVEAARPGAETGDDTLAEQERLWVLGCHLSALAGYLLPFGHLIGPLAIWLARRRALPGVESAGRKVLNFQLSVTLYVLAGLMLSFFLIGLIVLFLVVVFHFSVVLYASLRAQRGLDVTYPLSLKFI